MKRVLFLRRYRFTFKNHFIYTISFFLKKSNLSNNILANKIPITSRVMKDSTLELFYKLNKNLKEDCEAFLSAKGSKLDDYSDFTIYLRNYYQKPY